ncbi:PolC-type DNA polymerase III [Paenibacillus sp. GCM10023252]|uniref:3'-5' exonuclease n=1 Tax=Paenibacillus sp. GCM10023252 TaxID=3252649 RepID=UPI00360A4A9F
MKLTNMTVIDFETSGLNPEQDRIIEVAAIRCHEGEIVSRFSTLVQFDGVLSPKITEITGIQTEDLVNGMDEETALRVLNRFIGGNTIVAHNAAFDLSFLHYGLMRHAGRSFRNDFIDTLTICRDHQVYPHTLGEMCQRYGIDLSGAHRALNDVEACWALLGKLNEEQQVEDYINKLSYIAKYGPPKWLPAHANTEPVRLKYA